MRIQGILGSQRSLLCLTFRAAIQILLEQVVILHELLVCAMAGDWRARISKKFEDGHANIDGQAGSMCSWLVFLREQIGVVVGLSLAIANVGGRSVKHRSGSRRRQAGAEGVQQGCPVMGVDREGSHQMGGVFAELFEW